MVGVRRNTAMNDSTKEGWGGINPYSHLIVSAENCFLCGGELADHKSDEHIFPQWLLRRHNLWNHEITLSNRTRIPYRQLTIPCCGECNTKYLSQLESRVGNAFQNGAVAVRELPETDIFIWVAKINYGLTFKECFLLYDQADPGAGTIVNPDYTKTLDTLHGFMQAVRLQMGFERPHPWSIFVFETHAYPGEMDFDWHGTPWKQLTFTIRSHGVGIIASLLDNAGQTGLFGDAFRAIGELRLHPIQFDELSAMSVYQASLLDRTPKYISAGPAEGGPIQVFSMPLGGFSMKPVYRNWDMKNYARLLEYFWQPYGLAFEDIYAGNEMVRTTVETDGGSFPMMDAEGKIIGTRDIW